MRHKILFVISDPQEAQDVAHLLGGNQGAWDLVFAKNAAEGSKVLEHSVCNVVVSDLMLPDGDGMAFLDRVMGSHPTIPRLVLATLEEKESGLRCIGSAHQILARPYDAKRLNAALSRALETEAWVPNESTRELISQMKHLPSPPYIYFRVMRELRMPEPSLETIGALIARDPVMSAKLLHAANSASLGLSLHVSNPAQAVLYLGLELTQALVLLAHTCSFYEQVEAPLFSIEHFWNHSIRTGQFAQRISKFEKADANTVDQAFTAGLLHDLGQLIMAANVPQKYREALQLSRAHRIPECETERRVFGATHAEIGGCLLATWGLPWPIVEAVALHHVPKLIGKPAFSALTAVHVANVFELIGANDVDLPSINMEYLAEIGLADRLDKWKSLVGQGASSQ